jgi:6-phosphogluconolactonase
MCSVWPRRILTQQPLRKTTKKLYGSSSRSSLASLTQNDGHTASLFPGTAGLQEKSRWVIANWVEKMKTSRLTFTLPVLNAARCVAFLVSGTDKATVLRTVLEEDVPAEQYPAKLVRPTDGKLIWLLDRAAASELTNKS